MNKLPIIAMLITASMFAGFAVWLGSNPIALLQTFGVEQSNSRMLTEIRAFYGGIELAIGVLMLLLWCRQERTASLLVGAFPLLGSVCGRCLGILVDGFDSTHLILAGFEFGGASFCLLGCYLLGKCPRPDVPATEGH